MPEPSRNSMPYADTTGFILAGGMGARLGGLRKADLLVGGHRLLDLACASVGAQCQHTIVAIGDHLQTSGSLSQPLSFVADPGLGPAAAILSAAQDIARNHPASEYLMVAPCDAPFMPPEFAQCARERMDRGVDVIIGTFAERAYPTHALWRTSSLIALRTQFTPSGNPALFALLDRVQHVELAFESTSGMNPFFNVNTVADLLAANRQFTTQTTLSFS